MPKERDDRIAVPKTRLQGLTEMAPRNRVWPSPGDADKPIFHEYNNDLLELHIELGMRKGSFVTVGGLRRRQRTGAHFDGQQ